MSESSTNVDIAHKLTEKLVGHQDAPVRKAPHDQWIELVEAFLLAIVAVATAWSGYQASCWDGRSAERYAESAAMRIDGEELTNAGGQERLHDIATFNTWLEAKTVGSDKTAELLERRFSDDYKPAFDAWLGTDPFKDPAAPPGPSFMQEYANRKEKEGAHLRKGAAEKLIEGTAAREIGEQYVRVAVFLATVLFMIAISQRFSSKKAQLVLLAAAAITTVVILGLLLSYEQA